MRKSGWAGAVGVVAMATLLTACSGGGSSSSSSAGGSTPSTSAQSTATPAAHASGGMSPPPPGGKYFSIQKASQGGKTTGYILVYGAGLVVYTYAGDTAGKAATCTGGCAAIWPPVTGVGLVSPADNYPASYLGTINGQITWKGMPLYIYKGEKPHESHAGGQWRTIPMPASYIIGGA